MLPDDGAQRGQRGTDLGRVVRVVVKHPHTVASADQLDILSPNAQAELGDYTNFVNPRVVLQDHNMNIPPITEPNDILSIPEPYLQHLPTFMFKPIKVDQGQGSWKHVYPKRRNNIRTDFTILGRHVAYK